MKKTTLLFLAVLLTVVLVPLLASGQEQGESQKIAVKSREVSNGVVILTVRDSKTSFELQCNQGASGCTALDPADYVMVRLPKNHGLYDCANVEVYRQSTTAERGDMLGQYCLIGAK
jgi:hypothetical protein